MFVLQKFGRDNCSGRDAKCCVSNKQTQTITEHPTNPKHGRERMPKSFMSRQKIKKTKNMKKILLLATIALSMNAVAQNKHFTNSRLFPFSHENLQLKTTESKFKAPAKNTEASSKQAIMLKAPAIAKYNQLIDSVYHFNWDTYNDKWSSCNSKTINKYDAKNNLTSKTYTYWNGINWSIFDLYTYTYDTNNRETSDLYQSNNDTILANMYRSTTTYDGNNNQTKVNQDWKNGAWVNSSKDITTNSINGTNMLMELIDQQWESTAWVNSYKYVYNMDISDKNSPKFMSATFLVWNGSAWENYQQYINISYQEGYHSVQADFWTFTSQSWVNGAWLTIQDRTYDATTKIAIETEKREKTMGGNDYMNYQRQTTTYDANINPLNKIVELWETTAWVNNSKEIYTTDANNNCTGGLIQYWKKNWVDSCKYTITFDANKNMTSSNYQNWNGSTWVKSSQTNLKYDANSFIINQSSKDWDLAGVAISRGDSTYNYYRTVLAGVNSLKMADANVAVYPNPTTSHIQIKGIEGKANLNVFGIDGKLVLSKAFTDKETISVGTLAKGIYMIRISTAEGIIEKKLVKN